MEYIEVEKDMNIFNYLYLEKGTILSTDFNTDYISVTYKEKNTGRLMLYPIFPKDINKTKTDIFNEVEKLNLIILEYLN